MTKIKLSPVEKHLIRDFVIAILIQIALILLFVYSYKVSAPIELSKAETYEVTVEYTGTTGWHRHHSKFYIKGTDSKLYVFPHLSFKVETTDGMIYDMLSSGDKLTITCYKSFHIFWGIKYNVIEAWRGGEVLRTYDEYVKSREGLPIVWIVLFSIFELVFIFMAIVRFSFEKNTAKVIYRKIKKQRNDDG